MKIRTDPASPGLGIAEDAVYGLVIFFQEHEGPTGPIPSKTEKWVRAESTLDATSLVRALLAHGEFSIDPDLDLLIVEVARRQGPQVAEVVSKNLSRNGVLAAEVFPDGTAEIRVSSMLGGSWERVVDALEDTLHATRTRATLKAILPDELELALGALETKVRIAQASDLPGGM